VRENPLKRLFSTEAEEEKRGYPPPIIVERKRAINIDKKLDL